jgi:hypothetical protein
MRNVLVFAGLWAALSPAGAATLRGRILDSRTGEPVGKAEVVAAAAGVRAVTDGEGRFTLELPNGNAELAITTIGYGLVKQTVAVRDGVELELVLQQETAVRRDSVTVTAGTFEGRDANPPAQWTLSTREIQALSMVLIGDPLRAAQAAPSVTSNNDFRAEFAVRGAGYERLGIYVDGVLTGSFVHASSLGVGGSGSSEKLSLSAINSDTVSEMTLLAGAFPARYGGGSAAALSLETREGSSVKPSGRLSTGVLSTSAVVDGPMARRRGSWLLAGRSTYADYLQRLVERLTRTGRYANDQREESDSHGDFSDGQVKGTYTFSPRHTGGVSAMFGILTASEALRPGTSDVEQINRLRSENLLATAYWRYTAGAHLWTEVRTFALRDGAREDNRNDARLDDARRQEAGFRGDVSGTAGPHGFEAGVYVRVLQGRRRSNGYSAPQPFLPRLLEAYDQSAEEDSYYAQDTWKRRTLSVTAGARAAHSSLTGETIAMPRAAAAYSPRENWTFRFGAGRYAQFPEFAQVFGFFGNRALRADRSTHFDAAVERRWGLRTRLLAEFYDREDRRLPFSFSEVLLVDGKPTALGLPFRNVLRGHARGGELSLQRRSANGLTGWVSYAYAKAQYRDEADGLQFPADFDQRHTLTAFGSYRLRPTVELSSQWRYGSGTPVPGFWKLEGGVFRLAAERNQARLSAYERLDVRVSKAFLFARWKLTVSGEVLNVLNRKNSILLSTDPLRIYSSGRLSAGLENSFGVLPALAVAISF